MNVTLDRIDNVNGVITLSIEEKDYQEKVKKELKQIGMKHPLPGFRPGHVPASLLQKKYGKDVLVEIVNREIYDNLVNYIQENKLNILGEPIISNAEEVNFDTMKDFSFKFEVGFAPEVSLKLDNTVTVPYYNIEVDQKMVDQQNEMLCKRFGKQVKGEQVDATALVKGSMVELDENGAVKENGLNVESTIVAPQYFKSEDEKAKFADKKLGDEIVFNPWATCEGNLGELSSMMNVDREQADIKSDFKLTVNEILVNQPAELNQELFDAVFGKDSCKNEEEYFAKLKEMIAGQLVNDSNFRFTVDAEKVLREQVGTLELPTEFLKKWLVRQDNKYTAENIDEEFTKMVPQLEWQLIKEQAAKQLDVKVNDDDLLADAKRIAYQQFAQYGMTNIPEDMIEKYAKDILENKEYRSQIVQQSVDNKLYAEIKNAVKLDEKTVNVDEFNALFAEK
ncbi:MAG: trigger factor [Muribaculaceae bacterium]|nr:trigger factor [Muribaculaceae bacterium]